MTTGASKDRTGTRGERDSSLVSPEMERMARELAQFRYTLRKFLRFSENAARACRVTPQQHQLLLGIQGFSGRGSASVTELAEFLQERHHSVVGLVERAVQSGLVRRTHDAADRRVVNVTLTPKGKRILLRLTRQHYEEARKLRGTWERREIAPGAGAAKSLGPKRGAKRNGRRSC